MERRRLAELVLNVTDRDGATRAVNARAGEALMPFLRDLVDVSIGICGGVLSCGTCLVHLDETWTDHVPEPLDDEIEMLEALDAPPGARLACQLLLSERMNGLSVTVAPEA